jgi:hypothetical protein
VYRAGRVARAGCCDQSGADVWGQCETGGSAAAGQRSGPAAASQRGTHLRSTAVAGNTVLSHGVRVWSHARPADQWQAVAAPRSGTVGRERWPWPFTPCIRRACCIAI